MLLREIFVNTAYPPVGFLGEEGAENRANHQRNG
jgi:hypothetical protein